MVLHSNITKDTAYSQLPDAVRSLFTVLSETDTSVNASFPMTLFYYFQSLGLQLTDVTVADSEPDTVSCYLSYNSDLISADDVKVMFPGLLTIESTVIFINVAKATLAELIVDPRFKITGSSSSLGLMADDLDHTETIDLTNNWAKKRIYNRFAPGTDTVDIKTPINAVPVNVYIMDSGIAAHNEITCPVTNLYTITDGDYSDIRGHGTAIASLVAGTTLGNVHDNVTLKNVKILHDTSDIAMDQLVQAFIAIRNDVITAKAADSTTVSVVNMSWVIPKNPLIETIIASLMYSYGIMFVAAAGNAATAVDSYTPASMPEVITVGASDENNAPSVFTNYNTQYLTSGQESNFGSSIDLFAPGTNINVAVASDPTKYMTASGTSFSAAITTGVLALMAQCQMLNDQFEAATYISNTATKDAIDLMDAKYRTTPNRLLYVDLVTQKDDIELVSQFIAYDVDFFNEVFQNNPDEKVLMHTGTDGSVLTLDYDTAKLDLLVDGNKIYVHKDSVKTTDPYESIKITETISTANTVVTKVKQALFLYNPTVTKTTTIIKRDEIATNQVVSPERAQELFDRVSPDTQTVEVVTSRLDIESLVSSYPDIANVVVPVTTSKTGCGTYTSCNSQYGYSACTASGPNSPGCLYDNLATPTCTSYGGTCVSNASNPCGGTSCYTPHMTYTVYRSGNLSICCLLPGVSSYDDGFSRCACV